MLDLKAQAQLARILRIAGDCERFVDLKPAKRSPQAEAAAQELREPTTAGECPKCDGEMRLETYLVEFLAIRAAEWPVCAGCQAGDRRAA
jgi:hypothetical protein